MIGRARCLEKCCFANGNNNSSLCFCLLACFPFAAAAGSICTYVDITVAAKTKKKICKNGACQKATVIRSCLSLSLLIFIYCISFEKEQMVKYAYVAC